MPPELQLAALPVGRLQLHAEQQLGRGARAHVAPYPHHRRRLLGGLCGGISGQLSGDVRHRSVSFSAIGTRQTELFPTPVRVSCAFINLYLENRLPQPQSVIFVTDRLNECVHRRIHYSLLTTADKI